MVGRVHRQPNKSQVHVYYPRVEKTSDVMLGSLSSVKERLLASFVGKSPKPCSTSFALMAIEDKELLVMNEDIEDFVDVEAEEGEAESEEDAPARQTRSQTRTRAARGNGGRGRGKQARRRRPLSTSPPSRVGSPQKHDKGILYFSFLRVILSSGCYYRSAVGSKATQGRT